MNGIRNLVLTIIFILTMAQQTVCALPVNEDVILINQTGRSILAANHLPSADFIITNTPDTFDDYFIKANVYKTVEMFTWELKFAQNEGELAAVIARQIGKISNNMPTVSRSQAKTNGIVLTDRKGHEIMKYETKHILSYEKLNKDDVSLAADRTGVDFMIQSGYNPLALLSVYGRYLDYDEDAATEHIMNIYDYINYNFPNKLQDGYPTDSYKKALKVINQRLAMRSQADRQNVLTKQAKINEKKLKQANSAFKGMNPWNSSYTTLLLHK